MEKLPWFNANIDEDLDAELKKRKDQHGRLSRPWDGPRNPGH